MDICGKTGSTQVIGREAAERLAQAGREVKTHSWFTGFAPRSDPRVVVTVLVEYGGGGGATAAPLAGRIFGLLPEDQAAGLKGLWEEFEARKTPEARFAHALDRFQAFMHNYATEGEVWRRHGIRRGQVLERMRPVADGAPLLWEYVRTLIDDAVAKGYLVE
jgi:hypothetical protein